MGQIDIVDGRRKSRRLCSDPSPPARLLRTRSSSSSTDERARAGQALVKNATHTTPDTVPSPDGTSQPVLGARGLTTEDRKVFGCE